MVGVELGGDCVGPQAVHRNQDDVGVGLGLHRLDRRVRITGTNDGTTQPAAMRAKAETAKVGIRPCWGPAPAETGESWRHPAYASDSSPSMKSTYRTSRGMGYRLGWGWYDGKPLAFRGLPAKRKADL